jgi:hypothetical protein
MNTSKDNLPENIQEAIQGDSSADKEIISKAQKGSSIKKPQAPGADQLESKSGISIVKNPEFEGVAEPPKSLMELVQEMTGQRGMRESEERESKKATPIFISRESFRKKISPIAKNREPSRIKKNVPVLGEDSSKQPALIEAPVDYKIFKDQWTWDTFTTSHRGKLDKSCRSVDFTIEEIAILVSMSEFPSGIFKVVKVINSENETIIRYKIDPIAMSAELVPREYDHYSCAVIKKNNLPIRLEQVP